MPDHTAAIQTALDAATDALEQLPDLPPADRREAKIVAEGLLDLAIVAASMTSVQRRPELPETLCLGCQQPFHPASDRHTTCSPKCRKRLSRMMSGQKKNTGHHRGRPTWGERL